MDHARPAPDPLVSETYTVRQCSDSALALALAARASRVAGDWPTGVETWRGEKKTGRLGKTELAT